MEVRLIVRIRIEVLQQARREEITSCIEHFQLTENGLSTVGSPNGLSSNEDIFHVYRAMVSNIQVWKQRIHILFKTNSNELISFDN